MSATDLGRPRQDRAATLDRFATLDGPVPDRSALERPLLDRFSEALSATTMGPRLATAGLGGPCHVLDAKLEPGVRAVVLYECGGRLVRGDLLGVGAATPSAGLVVEPGVSLSPFPLDPDLPSLPRVTDPRHLGPELASVLGGTGRPRLGHPERLAIDILRYRPGKRLTARLRHPGLDGPLVAKAYHDDAKATAVATEAVQVTAASQASCRGGRGAGLLAFAPPVGSAPCLGVVFQEAVRGLALDDLLGSRHPVTATTVTGAARAGAALAELHDLSLPTGRQRPVEAELLRFAQRSERVAAVRPQLGESMGALADRLVEVLRTLAPPRTGPVHGDFKPGQLLLRGDRVVLLDLDHLGTADQAVDAGTFIASLRQQAVRSRLAGRPPQDEEMEALSRALLEGYLRAGGPVDQLPRIRWHVAVALERKALRAFARSPRSPFPALLVDEAQRCLRALDGERP